MSNDVKPPDVVDPVFPPDVRGPDLETVRRQQEQELLIRIQNACASAGGKESLLGFARSILNEREKADRKFSELLGLSRRLTGFVTDSAASEYMEQFEEDYMMRDGRYTRWCVSQGDPHNPADDLSI